MGSPILDTHFTNFVLKFVLPPLVIGMSILPLAIVVSCLVSNVDVTYFLLCKFGLINTGLVVVSTIGHLLRLMILCIVSLEPCRSGAQIVFIVFAMLSRIEKITKCLAFFNSDSVRFRFFTNIVYIEFKKVQSLLDKLVYIMFTPTFWLVVLLVWALVRYSSSQVSFTLYVTVACLLVSILSMLLCLIPMASRQMDAYKNAIKENILCAKQLNIDWKTKQSRFLLKQAACIRLIELNCGYNGKLGREFSNHYFSGIVLRCFDAILLFHTTY